MQDPLNKFGRNAMPKWRYRFLAWRVVTFISAVIFCLIIVIPDPKRADMLGTLFPLATIAAAVFNGICWLVVEVMVGFKRD